MAPDTIKDQNLSPYAGCCILLTTKHQKSIALAPVFEKLLGAGIMEYVKDTDQLGTFSGEIKRPGSALETVRKKCAWSLEKIPAEYALASEGCFGPHPIIPFAPANREILYFIDTKREFHLYISDVYTETNYRMGEITSLDEIKQFAEKALFPSHALIVRPFPRDNQAPILKGIQSDENLERAFFESLKLSPENKVWVETDMRAHLNPTRMKMIASLGTKLAHRLNTLCPNCQTPGWGTVDIMTGLPCNECGLATGEIKAEVFGCTKCPYQESSPPHHGKESASPEYCTNCNP